MVLEAPFASAANLVDTYLRGMPRVGISLGGMTFDAASQIGRVRAPIFMASGGRERLIPRSSAAALFAAAPNPKRWLEVPEAGRNTIFESAMFWRELHRFLGAIIQCAR